MKFYAAFSKVEENADGTLTVEGIASTEAVDSDGEVVKAAAIEAAIPDYMRYGSGAMREMHQPMAAGRVDKAEVIDGVTHITGTVVDPIAVKKVQEQVYKGFSIGGKATSRDQLNKKHVTGVKLVEISLVDRPANPDAVISMWKAEGLDEEETIEKTEATEVVVAPNKGDDFEQVWRSSRDQSVHLKKSDLLAHHKALDDAAALQELAGPALNKLGEIEAAMSKGEQTEVIPEIAVYTFPDGNVLAIADAEGVAKAAEAQASGPTPFQVKRFIIKRARELNATDALPEGWVSTVDDDLSKALSFESIANLLQLLGCINRAEDSFEDDYMWSRAVNATPELKSRFGALLVEFGDIIRQSLDMILSSVSAEEAAEALLRGDIAVEFAKVGARNSRADATKLQEAHDALVKMGADCGIGKGEGAHDLQKTELSEDIAKALSNHDNLQKAYDLLTGKLDELAPKITDMAKRNDEMAKEIELLKAQPLPARTAGPLAVVSKEMDTIGSTSEPVITKADVEKALADLSPEERALTLIKLSHTQPLNVRFTA